MNIRAQVFGSEAATGKSPLLGVKRPTGAKSDLLDSISVPRLETRTSNGRGCDRHRLGKPAVRIAHRGAETEVVLINLSGGGAMVEGDVAPRLWDRVDLRLADDGVIECAVRWLKGKRIGLEFAHETQIDCPSDEKAALLRQVIAASFPAGVAPTPSAPAAEEADEGADDVIDDVTDDRGEIDHDQRGDQRHPLIWSGSLHYNHDTTPVRLRNISPIGALIECTAALHVGGEPLLDLGEGGSIFATISWVVGDQAGLQFKQRFDLRGLARKRPQVAPARWERPSYLDPKMRSDSPWAKQWKRVSIDTLRDDLEGFMKR